MQYVWLDILLIMPEISEWFYRFSRPKERDEGTKKINIIQYDSQYTSGKTSLSRKH